MLGDSPFSESLLLLLLLSLTSSGVKTEFSYLFVSPAPHSREDRISPRKLSLCEVWVPEMSVTSLEVPGRVKASESRGTDGRWPTV